MNQLINVPLLLVSNVLYKINLSEKTFTAICTIHRFVLIEFCFTSSEGLNQKNDFGFLSRNDSPRYSQDVTRRVGEIQWFLRFRGPPTPMMSYNCIFNRGLNFWWNPVEPRILCVCFRTQGSILETKIVWEPGFWEPGSEIFFYRPGTLGFPLTWVLGFWWEPGS